MAIYKDKRTGKLTEVMPGTRMPASFELVTDNQPEQTKKVVSAPKPAKTVKKTQRRKNLAKKVKIKEVKED